MFINPFENRSFSARFAAVFSNAGFFALPLAQALIDTPTSREGSLYAAVYLAVFNIVLWTWGYVDMSGDKKAMQIRKILLNPGIIGVTVGMAIFVSPLYLPAAGGLHLPGVLKDALFWHCPGTRSCAYAGTQCRQRSNWCDTASSDGRW